MSEKIKTKVIVTIIENPNFGVKKQIKLSDGRVLNSSPKTKVYKDIPDNFSGEAEIEIGEYLGKPALWAFKPLTPVSVKPAQTTPQSQTPSVKAEYKADPLKIANEKFIALCEMWCKCIYNAVEAAKGDIIEKNQASVRVAAFEWFHFGVEKINGVFAPQTEPKKEKEEETTDVPF